MHFRTRGEICSTFSDPELFSMVMLREHDDYTINRSSSEMQQQQHYTQRVDFVFVIIIFVTAGRYSESLCFDTQKWAFAVTGGWVGNELRVSRKK